MLEKLEGFAGKALGPGVPGALLIGLSPTKTQPPDRLDKKKGCVSKERDLLRVQLLTTRGFHRPCSAQAVLHPGQQQLSSERLPAVSRSTAVLQKLVLEASEEGWGH